MGLGKKPQPSFFTGLLGSLSSDRFKGGAFICATKSHQVWISSPRSIFLSSIRSNTFSSSRCSCSVPKSAVIPCFTEKPSWVFASETDRNKTHVDISPESCFGIGRSVISRCSHIWEKKDETFAENSSLQDILKEYGDLSPETPRRFWRVSALNPGDFLEILTGFGHDVDPRKVEFLWKLFRWAPKKSRGFFHLPRSYEIMTSMLIRAGMLGDAEFLLLSEEARRMFSGDIGWMFSEIIQRYAEDCRLENSIALYDRARNQGLVLLASCYQALLNLLIRKEKAELVLRVYVDMIEVGLGSTSEGCILEFVIRQFSNNGEILEAVNILRRVRGHDVEPSPMALTAIVEGYCRKKDYEDALNFMKEWKHIPETSICNKIVSSLCRNRGTEEAWLFVQRMEVLGFELDALTFGILIAHSCRERKLRSGFIYLSESSSRSINPKVHAYNALISGVFKEGLYRSAKKIFEDMVEKGIMPDLSMFKVLLAGYCQYRKFDEVKEVIGEMVNRDMISLAPVEDALSKAFKILGIDRLGVKVKRDNDVGLVKAEFFDSLGNGLYLETDIEEYDKILAGILENKMFPDFNSMTLEKCRLGDIQAALTVKNEAFQWGQDLSLSAYSELLKGLCESSSHIKEAICYLKEIPELWDQLDLETVNLLIQNLSKNGMTADVSLIMDRLLKNELLVESDTYTALVMGFCKENANILQDYWELVLRTTFFPGPTDIKTLISILCKSGMIREMLELFDCVIEKHPNLTSSICNVVIKELCLTGFASVGGMLVDAICQRGLTVDQSAYIDLIKGFLKEQRFTEALGILDELLEDNIVPSVNVYKLLVPSLFRLDRTDKAMSLKQSLLSTQFKHAGSVYCILVNELSRLGRMKEAVFQLQEMHANKISPDNSTLNSLLVGYCRANNLEKSLEILCIMVRRHANLSVSGYRGLVRQMCSRGWLLGALSLIELMMVENESHSLILHNILIFYLFQTNNSVLVESLLNNMQEKHLVLDRNTYNFLIYGFYKCGSVCKSVRLLNTMIAEGIRPSNRSLRTVICYLCSQGEYSKALELTEVMERECWEHGSVIQNVLTLGLLLHGGLSKAEFFLDRMEEKNLIPNYINYNLLIKHFCLHGNIKKAVHLLNVMLKKGSFPSKISYSLVIHELCSQQAFDQALDFYVEMLHKGLEPSVESCDALVHGLCVTGRADDARKILGLMLQFGPIPTSNMYNCVIDRYYSQNNIDKASELLQEMQQAGHLPNFETHWSLISNLSSFDDKEDDSGKGILSRLLSGNALSRKNNLGTRKAFK